MAITADTRVRSRKGKAKKKEEYEEIDDSNGNVANAPVKVNEPQKHSNKKSQDKRQDSGSTNIWGLLVFFILFFALIAVLVLIKVELNNKDDELLKKRENLLLQKTSQKEIKHDTIPEPKKQPETTTVLNEVDPVIEDIVIKEEPVIEEYVEETPPLDSFVTPEIVEVAPPEATAQKKNTNEPKVIDKADILEHAESVEATPDVRIEVESENIEEVIKPPKEDKIKESVSENEFKNAGETITEQIDVPVKEEPAVEQKSAKEEDIRDESDTTNQGDTESFVQVPSKLTNLYLAVETLAEEIVTMDPTNTMVADIAPHLEGILKAMEAGMFDGLEEALAHIQKILLDVQDRLSHGLPLDISDSTPIAEDTNEDVTLDNEAELVNDDDASSHPLSLDDQEVKADENINIGSDFSKTSEQSVKDDFEDTKTVNEIPLETLPIVNEVPDDLLLAAELNTENELLNDNLEDTESDKQLTEDFKIESSEVNMGSKEVLREVEVSKSVSDQSMDELDDKSENILDVATKANQNVNDEVPVNEGIMPDISDTIESISDKSEIVSDNLPVVEEVTENKENIDSENIEVPLINESDNKLQNNEQIILKDDVQNIESVNEKIPTDEPSEATFELTYESVESEVPVPKVTKIDNTKPVANVAIEADDTKEDITKHDPIDSELPATTESKMNDIYKEKVVDLDKLESEILTEEELSTIDKEPKQEESIELPPREDLSQPLKEVDEVIPDPVYIQPRGKESIEDVSIELEEQDDVYKNEDITSAVDNPIKEELDKADEMIGKNPQVALNSFGALLSQVPNSARAIFGRAKALDKISEIERSNSKLEQAIYTYRDVLNLADQDEKLVPLPLYKKAAEVCIERMRFRGGGFNERAVRVQQRLLQKFPGEVNIRNQLGVSFLLMNQLGAAEEVFKTVLEIWPNNGFAQVHYGFILKSKNSDYVQGARYLKLGIDSQEEGTQDGRFYFHLGDALARIGLKNEAYNVYDDGVAKGKFLSRYQRSLYNIDRLKSRPLWTLEQTTYAHFFKTLEDNWKVIRDEGIALMSKPPQDGFRPETENLKETGDWKQFELFSRGRKITANCIHANATCQLIEKFPPAAGCKRGQVKFSIMEPKTHVWAHTGPTNCRLRSHLGLVVPNNLLLRVGTEEITWKEGKVLVFDDSWEHEVWHNGESFRLVLIVDVWHPEISEEEKKSLSPI